MAKASSTGSPARGSRGADEEDARLFRDAVRDVKPLPPGAKTPSAEPMAASAPTAASAPKVTTAAKPATTRRSPRPRKAPHERSGHTDSDLAEVISDEAAPTGADVLSFSRPGVRARTLKHLRRGLYPIENELDLHGLTQTAARDYLADFLDYSRNAGHRCVRIVHGKGYRSGARGPILKIAVNAWLKRHADVMAFTSARAIDGGTGAVYVLLRT
jgi:DNA-nicking Smr family endonuclease